MGDATVDRVTVFVDAWVRWSKAPGNVQTTRAKEQAAYELAGERATALLAHVAEACRASADPWTRVRPAAVEFLAAEHGNAA